MAHIRLNQGKGEDAQQFDLSSVVPRPAILEGTISPTPKKDDPRYTDQYQKALEETGFENWHDWCSEKWGTKWNSYEFRWVEQSEEKLVFTFETAWACPYPVIEKLIGLYPELYFQTASFDEMWNWASLGTTLPDRSWQVMDVQPDATMYKTVYGTEPDIAPIADEWVVH
jgi:hypothetical protein